MRLCANKENNNKWYTWYTLAARMVKSQNITSKATLSYYENKYDWMIEPVASSGIIFNTSVPKIPAETEPGIE